jgi:hypothetical protein
MFNHESAPQIITTSQVEAELVGGHSDIPRPEPTLAIDDRYCCEVGQVAVRWRFGQGA